MGLMMKDTIKRYNYLLVFDIFIALPVLLFVLGDFPSRDLFKDSISILTVLAFSLTLGEFFLTRSTQPLVKEHRRKGLISLHKVIGYFVMTLFFIHPFLIVLPRFFEAGPPPMDSFIKMVFSFDTLGITFGVVAWVLMILLGLTSFFREQLPFKYPTWRVFHGLLALIFTFFALWHSVDIGRHSTKSMTILMITLALLGAMLLLRTYFKKGEK